MKFMWIGVLSLVLIACQGNTQNRVEMKTQKDSVSYSIGLDIGNNLKQQMVDVNPEVLAQGIRDIITDGKPLLTNEQAQAVMSAFQQELAAKHAEKMREIGDKNKKDGDAFLEANKKKTGVQTTTSGLQYKVITAGTGPKPTKDNAVTVNYRGTLINGTEFDSSTKSGKPATFPLSSVMQGWIEALQMMPVGSKWELYIPPDLAYGPQGFGQVIGPNETLIFEVELLSIK